MKQLNSPSVSVISGYSMQHGILAGAFHAVSTGTMFTVYYRPWYAVIILCKESLSAILLSGVNFVSLYHW